MVRIDPQGVPQAPISGRKSNAIPLGSRALIVEAIDGQAPRFGIHFESDIRQPVLILAQHRRDTSYGEDSTWGRHNQAASSRWLRLPVPRQQLVERDRVLGDAGEDIGEPGLRIDVVHLGGDDQAVHQGGALAAAIGTREEPRFSAKSDTAQRPFGGIVGQADPAVVEEAREAGQRLSM